MAKRIIVIDNDVSSDDIKFVQRTSLPQTVTDLEAGEYYITNTKTNNSPVTVTESSGPEYSTPEVVEAPSFVLGNTTVGTTLNLNKGSASGVPTPTSTISYTRNGNVLTGQIYETLDTTGFVGGDVIIPHVTWTNLAGSISVSGQPLTLTSQPTIIATITPDPLVAGQQASITFNVAIDGSPTITQGQTAITATRVGTTNEWTFIPATTQPVSISATKAGYTPYSVVIENAQPAAPQLVNQNNQLVLLNVTTNTAPFTLPPITEPEEYAGTYTITPAEFVAGPIWLVPSEISRDGDVITLRRGLPIWLEAMEPVVRRIEWLRGATFETADIIEGADQATYTINAGSDSGKSIWAREVIEDNSGREIASISNAIQVAAPEPASWYHPDALVQIDYVGNRARINGTTYATIAEARTAGAIVVNSHGSDTVSFTPDAAWAMAGKGTTHSASPTTARALLAVDDGDDGNALDALVSLTWLMDASQPFLTSQMYSGGVSQLGAHGAGGSGPSVSAIVPVSTPVRAAINVETNNTITSIQGVIRGTDTSCVVPAVTTIVVGNRSDGARAWLGTIAEILVINSAKTGAELEGLLA